MHSRARLEDNLVALVSINPETERADAHGLIDVVRLPDVIAAARRYRSAATSILTDAEYHLHLAFDPALAGGMGNSARYVTMGEPNGIAVAVAGCLGIATHANDIVVVLGPDFVAWQTTPEIMAEVVADDLTAALQSLHPVRCKGPISKLMPFLVQIAGNIIMPGVAADEGHTKLTGRKERAIGRAFNSIASKHYGEDNPHGQVVTDNPAWLALAETVADAAGELATMVDSPMSRQSMVHIIHQAIARAMRNCDVPVSAMQRPA